MITEVLENNLRLRVEASQAEDGRWVAVATASSLEGFPVAKATAKMQPHSSREEAKNAALVMVRELMRANPLTG